MNPFYFYYSVININITNAEEILFLNKDIRESLPEFQKIFQQWDLAKTHLVLRNIAKKAVSDLLSNVNEQQIDKISNILGDLVTIDNLDYHIAKNIFLPLEEVELQINSIGGFGNFSISRNKEKVYMSFWR